MMELTLETALDFESGTSASIDSNTRNNFRNKLKKSYGILQGAKGPEEITCSLLGRSLPADNVIAAHIFPRKFAGKAGWLRISDINDTRNGVFLYKSIEHALDRGHLTFVYSPLTNLFHCRILMPELRTADIEATAKNLLEDNFKQPQPPLGMTFQDLENCTLALPSSHVVWQRVFAVHATLARQKAIKRKWITEDNLVEVDSDEIWKTQRTLFLCNKWCDKWWELGGRMSVEHLLMVPGWMPKFFHTFETKHSMMCKYP
ncbi:hypothetical protein DFS34DRAFT_498512 [Phlyctochytrium arcticum]|nr:hypothetical protein DFS34DRAFT_498512 [Phlyctochytrium arcticum]